MPPNAGFAYAKRHKKWVKKRLVCGGGCSPPAGGEGTGRLAAEAAADGHDEQGGEGQQLEAAVPKRFSIAVTTRPLLKATSMHRPYTTASHPA